MLDDLQDDVHTFEAIQDKKLGDAMAKLKFTLRKCDDAEDQAKEAVSNLDAERSSRKTEVSELNSELASVKAEREASSTRAAELEKTVQEAQAAHGEADVEHEKKQKGMEAEFEKLKADNENLTKGSAEMKDTLEKALAGSELGPELLKAQAEVKTLREAEAALTEQKAKLQGEIEAAIEKDKLDDKAVADLADAKVELSKTKDANAALEAKVKAIGDQHKDTAKEAESNMTELQSAQALAKKKAIECQALETSKADVERQLAESAAKMLEVDRQKSEAEAQAKQLEVEHDARVKAIEESHGDKLQDQTALEAQIVQLKQDCADTEKRVASMKEQLRKALEGHDLGEELNKLHDEIPVLQQQVSGLTAEKTEFDAKLKTANERADREEAAKVCDLGVSLSYVSAFSELPPASFFLFSTVYKLCLQRYSLNSIHRTKPRSNAKRT